MSEYCMIHLQIRYRLFYKIRKRNYKLKSKHKTSVLDTWTVLVGRTSPAVHASTFTLLWVGMALYGKYFTFLCEGLQKICFTDTRSLIPNQIPIYKIFFFFFFFTSQTTDSAHCMVIESKLTKRKKKKKEKINK